VRGIVIVLHDVFGLSDYVEQVARELAADGWWAVAPALFHREGLTSVPYEDSETGTGAASTLTVAGVLVDVESAIEQIIAAGAPAEASVAAVGFCLGGSISTLLATRRPLAACINFYGAALTGEGIDIPPVIELVRSVRTPWLSIYGRNDPFIPHEHVEKLHTEIRRCPAPAAVVTFEGGHAFHRVTTPDYYDPASAAAAWSESMTWLHRHTPAVTKPRSEAGDEPQHA